ncbi:MAG: VWA domain-containing protein [Vicinamibacteria bacterium]|nr:VWA domain-containing protein [Vicinamibacteria bacterium]
MRLSAVVMATLLATAAFAAGPQHKPADLPVFGVDSVVVAVPVFVIDKNGRAVPGLSREAFAVEDDGKPVPVVAFQAVDAGERLPPDAPRSTRAAARRQFLFLFDLSFSTPDGLRRAREAALKALDEGLAPGDLAAAATFGNSGLRILVGFTSDREQLRRAFLDLAGLQAERRTDPLNLAFDLGLRLGESGGLETDARRGDDPGRGADMDAQLRVHLIQQDQVERRIYADRVRGFLDGLEGLARLLDSIQGRKQVLLLSAGFDPGVLGGVEGAQRVESTRSVTEGRIWEVDSSAHFGDAVTAQAMSGLFDALAAADVVVHSLDVTGLGAGGRADAGGRSAAGGKGSESLAQLAINSGGRFVKSANDASAALREILDASRHYYVLAFEPRAGGKKPGQLRRLKVKVAGDGLKASHRAAWMLPAPIAADAPQARLATADAIVKGLEGGSFGLRAVAVPYRGANGAPALPFVLEIDGSGLAAGAKGALDLEVFGYAFDAEGRIEDAVHATPRVDLATLGPQVRDKGVQVLSSFRVTPGPHELHFVVRERGSGRAAAVRVPASVPDFAGPALSDPLFVDDPRTRVVVPAPSVAQPQLAIPFRLGETAFVPDPRPSLRAGTRVEIALFAWKHPGLGFSELTAKLLGGPDPVDAEARLGRSLRDADGFVRLVVTIVVPPGPAGDRLLELTFRDPETGDVVTTAAPVRVE